MGVSGLIWDMIRKMSYTNLCTLYPGCPIPLPPVHGNVDDSNGRAAGDTITYSCDSGYRLVGEITRECRDDTTWSGNDPVCYIGKICYLVYLFFTKKAHPNVCVLLYTALQIILTIYYMNVI